MGVGKLPDYPPIQADRAVRALSVRRYCEAAEQWQVQPIDMGVHDIKIFYSLRNRLEQSGGRHAGSAVGLPSRGGSARGHTGSPPRVRESPLANKVTSWPESHELVN